MIRRCKIKEERIYTNHSYGNNSIDDDYEDEDNDDKDNTQVLEQNLGDELGGGWKENLQQSIKVPMVIIIVIIVIVPK